MGAGDGTGCAVCELVVTSEAISEVVLSRTEVGGVDSVGESWLSALRNVTLPLIQSMPGFVSLSQGIPSTIFEEGCRLVIRNGSSCSSFEGRRTLRMTKCVIGPAEVGVPSKSSRRTGAGRSDG